MEGGYINPEIEHEPPLNTAQFHEDTIQHLIAILYKIRKLANDELETDPETGWSRADFNAPKIVEIIDDYFQGNRG